MPDENNRLIIRPIGQLLTAMSQFRDSVYKPPSDTISSIDESLWPNPLQPVRPMGPPGASPLAWPFNWGQNLNFTPRSDATYSAQTLRRLSAYPLARICIENTKDLICRMNFKVQLRAKKGESHKQRRTRSENDDTVKTLTDFFERPNHTDCWADFLRLILEDLFVIDAPSIYIGRTYTGKVAELRWVDGASITRLVDGNGWTPKPPDVAYQQVWQGYPRLDLTTDQLLYRPRNIVPRGFSASYIYGMSPTEQIADEIKIGIARLQYAADFYSEGTIPGGILFAPVGTPAEKIKEAQQWLDSDLAGQLAKRRRLQILQGFQMEGKSEQIHFPKEPTLTDLFDDVHTRKVCFAYGCSPNRLMKQMNRASAEQAQQAAEEEGTLPWLDWVKSTMDTILQVHMGYKEYEFVFDPFEEFDRLKQSMADAKDIEIGLYSRNEVREGRGSEPRDESEADELNVVTGQGLVPLTYAPRGAAAGGTKPGGGNTQPGHTTQVRTGAAGGKQAGEGRAAAKSIWVGCKKHSGEYPRTHCQDCIIENMNRFQKEQGYSVEEI